MKTKKGTEKYTAAAAALAAKLDDQLLLDVDIALGKTNATKDVKKRAAIAALCRMATEHAAFSLEQAAKEYQDEEPDDWADVILSSAAQNYLDVLRLTSQAKGA